MVFLYFDDLIPVFVTCICFSGLSTAHRILVPTKYSSFLQFKQNEDEQKTAQSTLIRILYLIAGTIVLAEILDFTETQIAIGIFISCFINIWPAIVENHLLKVTNSKEEWLLLLGYICFVFFSIGVGILTLRLFLPILYGNEHIYWLDNQAISLFLALITMAIPIPVESCIAKFSHVAIVQKIDTFLEEIYIYEQQLNMPCRSVDINKFVIDDVAKSNDINTKFLETIVKLECFYRKRIYYKFIETLLTRLFSSYAIKKDISVGIAQIKVSTAQKVLRQNPYLFIKKLCNDQFNIEICGKYIKKLILEYNYELESNSECTEEAFADIFDYIACQYLGGYPYNKEKTILIYSAVLRSVLRNEPIYYVGSDNSDRHLVTITGQNRISYGKYNKLKEEIVLNGIIYKEIFDNSTEFKLRLEVICGNAYCLRTIREIAEKYNLSIALG